jgi:hypothetical protein
MEKINSLVAKLRAAYPEVTFEASDDFYWSATTKKVHYETNPAPEGAVMLLHETAHALLGHSQFDRDIDLLKLEREAWDYARETLATRFDIAIDEEQIEDMIDTYRNWLHARSTCPHCSMTGVQTGDHEYHCVACEHDWRVNDARRCGLKRYSVTT